MKNARLAALALALTSPVAPGIAQEILFQDKFEQVAPGASPQTGAEGWLAFLPGSAGSVSVETDVGNRFGYGTGNQFLRINESIGFTLRTQRFSSEIVTASFDFIDDRTTISGGAEQIIIQFFATQIVNPETGAVTLRNEDRAHLAMFRNGWQIVGSVGHYRQKTRMRVDVVMNNQKTPIVYDSPLGPRTLVPERADVWINGNLAATEYTNSRFTAAGASADGPIEMVTLQNFSTDRFNGAVDNFTLFAGAHVLAPIEEGWTPPPPPVVLLRDDFNDAAVGAGPGLRVAGGHWNSITRPDGIVVARDTDNRFGYGTDNHYLKIDSLGGDLRSGLSAAVPVATLSFDFIDRANLAGTDTERSSFALFAAGQRVHNFSPVNGSIRGLPASRYGYHATNNVRHRADVVLNNSSTEITYTSPAGATLTLAAGFSDIWIDGVRVSAGHTLDRATAATFGPINELRFPTSSSTNRYSIDIDNLTVFSGARVLEPLVAPAPRDEPAPRELLAYEGFDYPAGAVSANGGAGWAEAFRPLTNYVSLSSGAPGLVWNNLEVSGNRGLLDGTARVFRQIDTTQVPSAVLTPLAQVGRPGSTVWVSFIAEGLEPLSSAFWGLSFYRGTDTQGGEVLFFGKSANEETLPLMTDGARTGGWKLQGATATLSTGIGRAFTGVPYYERSLWVMRIDLNELDQQQVYLFRNPNLDGGAPANAEAVALITTDRGNFAFDRVRLIGSNPGWEIDELRIGTSWASVTPTGTAPATGFSAWQSANFTALELGNPAISGPSADPDGDGIPNFLEYALGRAPRVAGRAGLPQGVLQTIEVNGQSGRYAVLTFNRPNDVTDVAYSVTSSGNLIGWAADAVFVSAVDQENGTTSYTFRSAHPVTAEGRRFLRLEVSPQ